MTSTAQAIHVNACGVDGDVNVPEWHALSILRGHPDSAIQFRESDGDAAPAVALRSRGTQRLSSC
jgi:hypothetical protein